MATYDYAELRGLAMLDPPLVHLMERLSIDAVLHGNSIGHKKAAIIIGEEGYNKLKSHYDEEIASPRYQELSSRIRSLRKSMGVNGLIIFCVDIEDMDSYSKARKDWHPILYLVDSCPVPDLSFDLGGKSAFNPKYIDELSRIARTGERVKSYFISKSDYGYNTCALLPVPIGGDVAVIAVEIPMRTLNSALRRYIIGALLVTLVVVPAIIAMFCMGFEKRFVAPIRRMAEAASEFISSGADSAMTSSIATLVVLSNDELCVLCDSLKQMQED